MTGFERREVIRELLAGCKEPISGTSLAKRFAVSRQVIVQDIAILRAGGLEIMATSQGYCIPETFKQPDKIQFKVACRHSAEDMEKELEIIVDHGGRILDVAVEHPVYGELQGRLMLSSRRDIKQFLQNIKQTCAEPLSVLTQGVHLHTIEVSDMETKKMIIDELNQAGILLV
jgi:uncharacterized protein